MRLSPHPAPQLQGAYHAYFRVLRRDSAHVLGLGWLSGYYRGFHPYGELPPHPLS